MAFDVVKQITDIEKEGEDLVKKAQNLALDIQKSAKEEAENIVNRAKQEADEYYKSVISKYENEAQTAAKPVLEESDRARKNLSSIPDEILNKAVNMVIERIVNSHGNS